MNTQSKILDKALEMFNEKGIEYVGMRELAATLNIRVSNITYYFPTKDDLVFEIAQGLSALNAKTLVKQEEPTMLGFLEMMRTAFNNHAKYRCLFISFVHLMEQNKTLSVNYKKTQALRNAAVYDNLQGLVATGYLKLDKTQLDSLVPTVALISRFWLSEVAISYTHLSLQKQMDHYLSLIINLLLPYSTAKAKKEIQTFHSANS